MTVNTTKSTGNAAILKSGNVRPLIIFVPAETFGGAENYIAGLIVEIAGFRPVTVVSGAVVAQVLAARVGDAADFITTEEIVYDWSLSPEKNAVRQAAVLDRFEGMIAAGAQVFVNLNWLNVAVGLLDRLRVRACPTVVLLHLCPHRIRLNDFEVERLRMSVQDTRWVCVADENRFFLGLTLDVSIEVIEVIQNGPAVPIKIPADTFAARDAARRDARKALGLPKSRPIVLTVGRHDVQKGFLEACLAIREVLYDVPDLLWVWLGSGGDIDVHKSILQICGMGHIALFTSAPDPTPWYAAADVFYQPSKYEGFSLSLLEGATAALPVVATEVSGTPELISDARFGDLVSPLRPLEHSFLLGRYLTMEPAARFDSAARLADRAKSFTRERMYSRMRALLDEGLGLTH